MKLKASFFNVVAMLALVLAGTGASINCYGSFYQPKFPDKLNTIK